MSEKAGAIAAVALIAAVLVAFFFVPVHRTSFNEFSNPDGSFQRVRTFENADITLDKYFRVRGTRSSGSLGFETTTELRVKPYVLRIGVILLAGGGLIGLALFASRKKKKN